jgi:hypothetical protein
VADLITNVVLLEILPVLIGVVAVAIASSVSHTTQSTSFNRRDAAMSSAIVAGILTDTFINSAKSSVISARVRARIVAHSTYSILNISHHSIQLLCILKRMYFAILIRGNIRSLVFINVSRSSVFMKN